MKVNNKVLQLTPFFSPNIGGVETHLDNLIGGVQVGKPQLVLTYQAVVGKRLGKKHEKLQNIEIIRLKHLKNVFYSTERYPLLHFLYLTPWLTINALLLLTKRRKEISVIHAHGVNAAFAAWFLHRLFSIDYFVSFHVEFNFKKNSLMTKIYTLPLLSAKKIFVLTDRSKKRLADIILSENNIIKYSYWVDQRVFSPIDKRLSREKLGLGDNEKVVLFVGRISRQKGVDKLLEAAKKLPDILFIVVGTGELEKAVESVANKLKNVIYVGRVDNTKLPLYYSAADVTIVPSEDSMPRPTFEEGVPRVMIESLSCGTPVIGTNSGGIKEVLVKGEVGVITKSEANSIISSISRIFSNKKNLLAMANKCRTYAKLNFSSKNIDIFRKAYNEETLNDTVNMLLTNTGDMALRRRAKWLLKKLTLESKEKVVDIGCGDGFFLHLLSSVDLDLHLTGTDYDEIALASAKRNLKVTDKIKLSRGDLMKKLPFPDNAFDKVIMSEVAEHLPEDVKGLKEVYRVLKPGGLIGISVPSKKYPLLWDPVNWILERLFAYHIKSGFWAGIWNQHERLYTKKGIEAVLQKSGFSVLDSSYQTWWCLPFNHHLLNFGARILAGEIGSKKMTKGGSKFKNTEKRGTLAKVFFAISETVDYLNYLLPISSKGVSIVCLAKKPER